MRILFTTLAGSALFWIGHALATASRGYTALGGEVVFLLAVPVIISFLKEVKE